MLVIKANFHTGTPSMQMHSLVPPPKWNVRCERIKKNQIFVPSLWSFHHRHFFMPSKTLYLLAIAAGSSVATAATNCNPSYNATTNPTCIANCNKKAGQGLWADWTDDPTSTNFVKSLSFQCEKGTPNYIAFMTSAGVCMTSCSTDDQSAFTTEFQQACQWYTSHVNDTCTGTSANSSSTSGASALQVTSLVVVCSLIASLGFM